MDPQHFYGTRHKMRTRSRKVNYIPDSSEDENISDDEDYVLPKPLLHVTIGDSDSNDERDSDDYEGQLEREDDLEDENEVDKGECEDDSEVNEEEHLIEQPSTSKQNKKQKGKKKDKLIWSDEGIEYDDTANVFLGSETLPDEIMRLKTPIEFFKFIFPSAALNLIEEESNIYAAQITEDKFTKVANDDVRKFIGILIYMSVVHLPTTRHYWKEGTYIEKVASTMTCNKFEEIKRFLHFFDKTKELKPNDPNFDKLQKIRPFLNILLDKLRKVPREEFLSIDEQMIPTKARTSGIRQYNAKKPHKWGYLNYVLSGVSGFSYDFEVYAGKHSGPPEGCPDLGVPGNVVQRLLKTVSHNLNFKIFVDNWYTSLPLMANLHKIGILPLGTIQLNRAKDIPLSKKVLMKKPRGHCEVKSTVIDDVQLAVTAWVDNKVVSLCSSYVAAEPICTVKRFQARYTAQWNYGAALLTEADSIRTARAWLLVPSFARCPVCHGPMGEEGRSGHPLGFRFRCAAGGCRATLSPLRGTVFERSRIGVGATLRLLFHFFRGDAVTRLAGDVGVTRRAASRVFTARSHAEARGRTKIGRPRDVVEIDETQLFRRKFHRGRRVRRKTVVFGCISRLMRKVFMAVIPDRKRETLDAMVRAGKHSGGSHLMADSFPAYRNIHTRLGSTQIRWSGSGSHLKRHCIRRASGLGVAAHVGEYLYRHNVLRPLPGDAARFRRLLRDVRRRFPGAGMADVAGPR
ncbi:hypothetical protein MSG28_013576 [Choristoneura fumiferana]|uniref:Uncharacterized protein n=1 Tax=Choristoneura fumiferana TaxID=7141 RepID=A0ACC0K7Z7_CHOFU|nr:hypothetical protein MSG28_013576 [Choristoneura fumiferana]